MTRPPAGARRSILAALLLLVVIVGGSWIRLADLGDNHFRGDELRHWFVAESIAEGNGPLLPSGERYVRGIDVSRLIGWFSARVDDPELAARLPGALFGILNLVLFAAIAWALGGPWAAVIATLLLAIHPEAVAQSRRVRFYTYQLSFGLIALFAGWKAVEWTVRPGPDRTTAVRRTWLWLAITAIAFALAARVQIVTLSVAAAWGVCLAAAAVIALHRDGWRAWRSNVALLATTGALVLALAAVAVRPGLLERIVWHASSVPAWVTEPQSPLTYYWLLAGAFPLVLSLAPVSFIVTARDRPWLAAYLLIWFGLPFVLHSLVLPFKGDRFILLAHPALMIATGIAAAAGMEALARALRTGLGDALTPRLRNAAVVAGCAVVALTAVATTPAFNAARQIPAGATGVADRENWTAAAAVLAEQPDIDGIVLGSSDEFAPLFYWPRLDFHSANGGEVDLLPVSPATGVPRLLVPDDIRRAYPDGATVIVALDSARLASRSIDPALGSTLREQATELCGGRCGSLVLYRWEVGAVTPGDTVAR